MVNRTLTTAYKPTSIAIPERIALIDDGADE